VGSDGAYLAFGDTIYFEQVDLNEALAHEAALNLVDEDGQLRPPPGVV
jgi:hypothetical protein